MRVTGFTLLEMIVVLAILGLVSALVAPAAIRGIDSWRRQAAMDELLDGIHGLPGEARARGQAIIVSDDTLSAAEPPLRMAASWTLSTPTAWQVRANGVCEGGKLLVRNELGERTIMVAAPFCEAAVVP